jgi:hypothetical protein
MSTFTQKDLDDAKARGRAEMKGEIARIIARRRLSAAPRVEAELAALIQEIATLN